MHQKYIKITTYHKLAPLRVQGSLQFLKLRRLKHTTLVGGLSDVAVVMGAGGPFAVAVVIAAGGLAVVVAGPSAGATVVAACGPSGGP